MFYRIEIVDHWDIHISFKRFEGQLFGGSLVLLGRIAVPSEEQHEEQIFGGPIVKRYFPQYARQPGGPWKRYTDLGFCKDGFEWIGNAEEFLEKKDPQWRSRFCGVHEDTSVQPGLFDQVKENTSQAEAMSRREIEWP